MKAIPTDKNISDVNIMCLLYHVYRVKYIVHYKWFDGDPRPMAFFHNCYLRHVGWERLAKIFFHLRLPVRPCGFSLLPSVVENLAGRTKRCSMICASLRSFKSWALLMRLPICSWLWILCAPLGLQNLTPGTPRFTHLCASLRSFKDGSLGIPGQPARM